MTATNHAKHIKKFLYALSVPDTAYMVGVNSTHTEESRTQKCLKH